MFLSFSDSKTETSKEILLKVFLKKTFNFRFQLLNTSLDGGMKGNFRKEIPSLGKPVLETINFCKVKNSFGLGSSDQTR
jgi:hypothetical protein